MKLMTKELIKLMPKLYAQEKKGDAAVAYVKFFTPSSNWTWWATEYDPETREFFGLVQGFEVELGYFSLDEMEKVKGPFGLGIERDMHWGPKTLREIKGEIHARR